MRGKFRRRKVRRGKARREEVRRGKFRLGKILVPCMGYPTTQNVCHWLFLTYKHVLSILQVISFGTLLSYPSLALGVGY